MTKSVEQDNCGEIHYEADRLVTPEIIEEEQAIESVLRPRRLEDFVGQEGIHEQLVILINAAQGRHESLDHILLYGPPGLGKTTLAHIIAAEMGSAIRVTSGPAIEHQGMLASILTSLGAHDILFVDEVHRLSHVVEEALYPAMEDFSFDWVAGKGVGAQVLRLDLQPFTIIGATTRAGALGAPLRDRFGITLRLDFYDTDELISIVSRSAHLLHVAINSDATHIIASRSRGTPRIANRLVRRLRDYAQVRANGIITAEVAHLALAGLGIDEVGLDAMDRRVLETLCGHLKGAPVGLQTLAVSVQESIDTIEDIVEPYLIRLGMIARTPRGRVATAKAFEHLDLSVPNGIWGADTAQTSLFDNS